MKHILVVEDEPLNAIVFRKVLERRGAYRVTVTEDAETVMQLARAGTVDLVIMDVSLAHTRWEGKPVTGVELCRILKSDLRTAGIPVLLATAHAMRGDAESLLAESGANQYVSKPILDHAAFVDQVRRFLELAA
jgi:CheY-like chemotaxis protein